MPNFSFLGSIIKKKVPKGSRSPLTRGQGATFDQKFDFKIRRDNKKSDERRVYESVYDNSRRKKELMLKGLNNIGITV